MSVCRRAAVAGAVLLAAGVPAAEASQADAPVTASAAARASLRLTGMTVTPAAVRDGRSFVVHGRVRNAGAHTSPRARFTFTLLASRTARRGATLRRVPFGRVRSARSRGFTRRVRVPRRTADGRWYLRVCVAPRSRGAVASCRTGAIVVRHVPAAPGAGGGGGPQGPPAATEGRHSLRGAVTDQNFYFVMADRFANGDTANDDGGLPRGKEAGESGFDPTGKGWYHGGDLKGLTSKIDYIRGLGTTAIWLTPSFKNKAVQPEDKSAGYHGYWITDFTRIDPHLGTNDDLRTLVNAAHSRGIKVYFDIIANHTADVIKYREGDRMPYVSKDVAPYKTAAGAPFDDRDYAGGSAFPPLDPETSFGYHPVVPEAEKDVKVPSWLNDVRLYHNRGDSTFTGENSQYGDFFGLDDLFTENPRVVDGMIDIYRTWIRDFRIDGFRMDTMKHVNDEFWQKFAPAIENYAHAQGIPDFYMFGEVADATRPLTSHYMTHDQVQGVLDFPFQAAAQAFAASSAPTDQLRDFFVGDDWYTDADSNAYQLPTFLGNHDMGRIGMFLRNANPTASEAVLQQRDELAHALMYFSRGNPVVYYGDEQGFTGAGGDQDARQDMFPSQSPQYNDRSDSGVAGDDGAGKNDDIGSDKTPMDDNFDPSEPLYRRIAQLAAVVKANPALRNGAMQSRWSSSGPGIYAFSRVDRTQQREYVVALNNDTVAHSASIPTYMASTGFTKVFGPGAASLASDAGRALAVSVPALSAVVYEADARLAQSAAAPDVSMAQPPAGGQGRDRMEVAADVGGDSFYEVTFYARTPGSDWRPIGTDDNAPYRVFHDVADLAPGTPVQYRAVVLDDAGHERSSGIRTAQVAEPAVTIEAPTQGGKVRGRTEVRAVVDPEHANDRMTFQRRVGSGDWATFGSDDTSPVYTAFDDITEPTGTTISYRAILDYGTGTVTSAERTVTVAPPPVTTAVVHYRRTDSQYGDWGLHLWGDAIADGVATSWAAPRQRNGIDSYGAFFDIPLKDDTKPVNFIVHKPSGDSVPTTREPGGDRSFVPADHPEIWLKENDATIYFVQPPS